MIGKFRTRIKIKERNMTPDNMGGFTEDIVDVNEIFAQVKELTGQRAWEFEKIYHTKPIEVIIRSKLNKVEQGGGGSFSFAFSTAFDVSGATTSVPYTLKYEDLIEYKGNNYVIHSIEDDQTDQFTRLIIYKK